MSDYNIDFGLTTSNSWILDQNKIEVNAGARLKRIASSTPDSLIEDFASSTGFVFDSTKSAITGGQLQQVDTRPTGASFYSKLNLSTSANWGNGSLGATNVKGGAIQNGRFEFSNTDVDNAIEYSPNSNVSTDIGTICFKYTPFYSGAPTENQNIIFIGRLGGIAGTIQIYHLSSGRLNAYFVSSDGSQYRSMYFDFFPTAGQTYEIELDYDLTNGHQYIFLDGILKSQSSYTMSIDPATLFLIGNTRSYNSKSNFGISNILIYNSMQHTADYTPDWSNIYDTIYAEDTIAIPTQTNTHSGDIAEFKNFVTTETGTVSYTLNGLWFNGTAWATADGTASQSNTSAEILANIITLPASNTLDITIFTTSSNTQNTQNIISNITTDYLYMVFPTDNPTMITASPINTDGIDSISATFTASGADNVKISIVVDGQDKFYDTGTSAWEDSMSYTETNNFSDYTQTILNLLLSIGASVKLKIYLHSDTGETTPELTALSMGYSFHPGYSTVLNKCIVYGFLYSSDGTALVGETISAQLNAESIYAEAILIKNDATISTTTDSTGYWELYLIENESMRSQKQGTSPMWNFLILNQNILKRIPDKLTANFMAL